MNARYMPGDRVLWRDRQNYTVSGVVLRVRMEPSGTTYEVDVNGMVVLAVEEDLRRSGGPR